MRRARGTDKETHMSLKAMAAFPSSTDALQLHSSKLAR